MELNFLQVVLSFQKEFKYKKRPGQKSFETITRIDENDSRHLIINSYIKHELLWPEEPIEPFELPENCKVRWDQANANQQLKTFKLEKLKASNQQ
jgi:hypothetical protein